MSEGFDSKDESIKEEGSSGRWGNKFHWWIALFISAAIALLIAYAGDGFHIGEGEVTDTPQGEKITEWAKVKNQFSILSDPDNTLRGDHPVVIVDNDTGVEYIVIDGYRKVTMTPRYNADGTLMIYEGPTE